LETLILRNWFLEQDAVPHTRTEKVVWQGQNGEFDSRARLQNNEPSPHQIGREQNEIICTYTNVQTISSHRTHASSSRQTGSRG
jgi:hypothetical protein